MGKESFKEKLNYFRKYAVTKLYCLNPRIKTIFILNDIKTVDFLNNEFSTAVFKMLPDPIAELEPLENFDIYRQYSSCKSRKIFLHIGSLGDRKGTFEVIDSARYISEKIQNEIFILLVGMAEDKRTEQIILDKIKQNTAKTKVKIVWDNQFVPHEMMKSLFDQSYAVLLPYKNTEASSGILGHAAASNKKIIATGKGLIKELIEDNNLGILLDSVSPIEIAAKIDEIFDCQNPSNSKNSFVEEHSPIKFAALILDRNQLIL
jgi:glycosyltransferase involved in cell wall biosynthesis